MATPDRPELPHAVRRMAERLGARQLPGGQTRFRQAGELRNIGSSKWMRFTATQSIDIATCNFDWRARTGPLGVLRIRDALMDGQPTGAVTALGLVPLARAKVSPELIKGQLMRYLAELPWSPDSLLSNAALEWEVVDEQHLRVSASVGPVSGEIAVTLDNDGLPSSIAGTRPAREGGGFIEREWHGVFSDWRESDGRTIPFSGRVWWIVDGKPEDVWRGKVASWQAPPS